VEEQLEEQIATMQGAQADPALSKEEIARYEAKIKDLEALVLKSAQARGALCCQLLLLCESALLVEASPTNSPRVNKLVNHQCSQLQRLPVHLFCTLPPDNALPIA